MVICNSFGSKTKEKNLPFQTSGLFRDIAIIPQNKTLIKQNNDITATVCYSAPFRGNYTRVTNTRPPPSQSKPYPKQTEHKTEHANLC